MSWFEEITYQEAEKIAGTRLDRRRKYYKHTDEGKKVNNPYAFNGVDGHPKGTLFTYSTWTASCSGCSDDSEYSSPTRGGGCPECGHHGVVCQGMHSPFEVSEI